MNRIIVLTAVAATFAYSSAFAGGMGPAPHYNPSEGAPASQRGQSAQTLAAELNAQDVQYSSYGGNAKQSGASGKKTAALPSTDSNSK
jgi:hypothetical protein